MLKQRFNDIYIPEAGVDEAGRGCLAGPVFAAAVILPEGYSNELLNDSKQLTAHQRDLLRRDIEEKAITWNVSFVSNAEIDRINILNASFLAMHKAISGLTLNPELLLIDGNRFTPFPGIPHRCIVKGDATYMSVAAASVLAKTHRDDFMTELHREYPAYGWDRNKGYPTGEHREAIARIGISPWHRKSFRVKEQLRIKFDD